MWSLDFGVGKYSFRMIITIMTIMVTFMMIILMAIRSSPSPASPDTQLCSSTTQSSFPQVNNLSIMTINFISLTILIVMVIGI